MVIIGKREQDTSSESAREKLLGMACLINKAGMVHKSHFPSLSLKFKTTNWNASKRRETKSKREGPGIVGRQQFNYTY